MRFSFFATANHSARVPVETGTRVYLLHDLGDHASANGAAPFADSEA
jgi:hypothetical protein